VLLCAALIYAGICVQVWWIITSDYREKAACREIAGLFKNHVRQGMGVPNGAPVQQSN
jgi:hypothetical protein